MALLKGWGASLANSSLLDYDTALMAGRQGPYPIDKLDLPVRARNALVRAGITTPGDLVERSDAELLALRGLGPTGLAQVRETLAAWEREQGPDEEVLVEAPEAGEEPGGR